MIGRGAPVNDWQDAPHIDRASFVALQERIREKTGIFFTDSEFHFLGNHVTKCASRLGIRNSADCLDGLVHSKDKSGMWTSLIEQVAPPLTSFFRHQRQLDRFRKAMVERMESGAGGANKRISVWCSACSSGEEPYSLAMICADLIRKFEGWTVEVMATDIVESRLENVRTASYSPHVLASIPEAFRVRYVVPALGTGCERRLVPEIVRMVRFANANLADPEPIRAMPAFDFVVCRNVLLYFDFETVKAVLNGIWNRTKPGGLIVLGPTDEIRGLGDIFTRTPESGRMLRGLTRDCFVFNGGRMARRTEGNREDLPTN